MPGCAHCIAMHFIMGCSHPCARSSSSSWQMRALVMIPQHMSPAHQDEASSSLASILLDFTTLPRQAGRTSAVPVSAKQGPHAQRQATNTCTDTVSAPCESQSGTNHADSWKLACLAFRFQHADVEVMPVSAWAWSRCGWVGSTWPVIVGLHSQRQKG